MKISISNQYAETRFIPRGIGLIFLLLMFFASAVFADSMMLSPAELDAIGLASGPEKPNDIACDVSSNNAKLRLDGIIFEGEKNWCIWLNGQAFTCGQNPANFKIVKVCHACVEMVAAGEPEAGKVIILKPGQTH